MERRLTIEEWRDLYVAYRDLKARSCFDSLDSDFFDSLKMIDSDNPHQRAEGQKRAFSVIYEEKMRLQRERDRIEVGEAIERLKLQILKQLQK